MISLSSRQAGETLSLRSAGRARHYAITFGIGTRMSIEASMVSYYSARACEYERIYQKPERQGDLRRLRSFVERVFAGAEVFEVACGTGYWTEVVARRAASVLATDINEEVLAIARAKPMDVRKVTFQRADAYAPSASRRFNAGFSAFWWSHVPKSRVRSFLQAFHGMLTPGARVGFMDNVYVEGSSTPISHRDAQGNTYQVRRLDDGSTHEVLKNFPTESELRAAVEGMALDVQVEFLPYYWTLTYLVPSLPPLPGPLLCARREGDECFGR